MRRREFIAGLGGALAMPAALSAHQQRSGANLGELCKTFVEFASGVALLRGFDTPSQTAQGGQRLLS